MLRQYMKHIKSIHLAQEASQSKNPKLGIFSISHLVVILYDRVPDKNAEKKSKNQKSMKQLRPSYVGGPPCQFLALTGHAVAQKTEWREKSWSGF